MNWYPTNMVFVNLQEGEMSNKNAPKWGFCGFAV
jgi:hypothetical protein